MERILILLTLSYLSYKAQSNYQVDALIDMKQKLNDSNNQLSNWYPNQISPCYFISVICDSNNFVTQLTLASMGFTGILSPRIGDLQYLRVLSLTGNKITGEIPNEFGNLSRLNNLNLENNLLTGEIPNSLGMLSSLQTLDLSGNNLTGSIPESISNISTLNNIGLAFNHLSGNIPDSLFKVPTYNFTNNSLKCGENLPHPCTSYIPTKGGSHAPKIKIILGSILGAIAFIALGIALIIFNSRKNDSSQDVSGENEYKINLGQIKRFTFSELQSATEDFNEKNIIGQGGFAKVYKGVILDNEKNKPMKIAIKRLTDLDKSKKREESFLREIEIIGVAVHKNLLKLIGFCVASNERILVYPFMENLSLASRLRDLKEGDRVLDWSTRKRIALGTAQGLEYLHEHCNPKIIHRDVKAANVLLNTDLDAVVADFGLARLMDNKKTSVTTQVRGTMGHIAPEYLSTGRSSEKTDVFGYGITLLELVTGMRSVCVNGGIDDEVLLLDHVKKLYRENRLEAIVDPNLNGDYDVNGVDKVIQVALLCAQNSPGERPAMSAVVKMLEGEGLDERWEDVQEIQITPSSFGRVSFDAMNFRRASFDRDASLYIPEAVELSGAR